jgi:nucleoid-associated protein YgaU
MANLEQLKTKYEPVLRVIGEQGAQLKNLHIQDDKLFMRAAAPTEEAKGYIWTAIKDVDRANDDLLADITVDSSLPAPKRTESYTVKSGDTLSKISKQFYGDANRYMKIFDANKDVLKDPDKIQPGQVLRIPAA